MRSPVIVSLGLIGVLGLLSGCGESTPPSETPAVSDSGTKAASTQQAPLKIVVSVLPQKYFVEKIGGDRVEVAVMVDPGVEPENYEPKPKQLKELSQADAYIGMGMLFETVWGDRLKETNPKMRWVNSAADVEKIPITDHHHEGESDHAEDEGLPDPHIWLSPRRVKQQAEQIYRVLAQLDPKNEVTYAQNLGVFLAEIDQLDQAIAAQLKPLKQRTFFIFHPSLGYFADDYDLKQVAIEVGGQEPSASELAELIQAAKDENIHVIFAQYQFNKQSAQAIAQEIEATVVQIDPLAANWSENLLEITKQFVLANSGKS